MFGKKRAVKEKVDELNSVASETIRDIKAKTAAAGKEGEKYMALAAADPLIKAIEEYQKITFTCIRVHKNGVGLETLALAVATASAELVGEVEKITGYKVGGKARGSRSTSKSTRKPTSTASN